MLNGNGRPLPHRRLGVPLLAVVLQGVQARVVVEESSEAIAISIATFGVHGSLCMHLGTNGIRRYTSKAKKKPNKGLFHSKKYSIALAIGQRQEK